MACRSQIKHHSFRWGARFENRRFLRFSGIFLRKSSIFFDNGFLELRCRVKGNLRSVGVKRRPFCFCLRQRCSVALPMWCHMIARSCVDLMCLCLSGSIALVLHCFLSSLCRAGFASACLCGFGYGLVFVLWVLLTSFASALRFGDALLYESPGGNQVDGLPPVCNCCGRCWIVRATASNFCSLGCLNS